MRIPDINNTVSSLIKTAKVISPANSSAGKAAAAFMSLKKAVAPVSHNILSTQKSEKVGKTVVQTWETVDIPSESWYCIFPSVMRPAWRTNFFRTNFDITPDLSYDIKWHFGYGKVKSFQRERSDAIQREIADIHEVYSQLDRLKNLFIRCHEDIHINLELKCGPGKISIMPIDISDYAVIYVSGHGSSLGQIQKSRYTKKLGRVRYKILQNEKRKRLSCRIAKRDKAYLYPEIFEVINSNTNCPLQEEYKIVISEYRDDTTVTRSHMKLPELKEFLKKTVKILSTAQKNLGKWLKLLQQVALLVQLKFHPLSLVLKVQQDIRYILRTLIRAMHIVTSDGKDEDNGFALINNGKTKLLFNSLIYKPRCSINMHYFRWWTKPSLS